jgi:hypothetical protein
MKRPDKSRDKGKAFSRLLPLSRLLPAGEFPLPPLPRGGFAQKFKIERKIARFRVLNQQ